MKHMNLSLVAVLCLASTINAAQAEPLGGGSLKSLTPRPREVTLPPKPPPGYVAPTPPRPPYQGAVDRYNRSPVKPQLNPPGLTYTRPFSSGRIGR